MSLRILILIGLIGVIAGAESSVVRALQTTGQPTLKIVVIAGEGAVNVVQQKTAVAPVVEVRDRNDAPVAGVAVTFLLGKYNVGFAGGARTLSVTTNAAGRATANGLAPLSSGPVEIRGEAAYEGQTATTTITQTTVMNAAAVAMTASAAAGASGGTGTTVTTVATTVGAGAAGSGGLSGIALGAIIGGAGAGTLAAIKVAGGGSGGDSSGTGGDNTIQQLDTVQVSGPTRASSSCRSTRVAPIPLTSMARCP